MMSTYLCSEIVRVSRLFDGGNVVLEWSLCVIIVLTANIKAIAFAANYKLFLDFWIWFILDPFWFCFCLFVLFCVMHYLWRITTFCLFAAKALVFGPW